MGEKKRFAPPAVGGASLLVVFAVLCLTVFALLSLTTVQADVRLANASVQAVSDYYAADCKAQEVLACLRAGAATPSDVEVQMTPGFDGSEGFVYTYAVPISDTQELQVEVRINGSAYTVLRWQAVPTGEWVFDDSLELWDGDFTLF